MQILKFLPRVRIIGLQATALEFSSLTGVKAVIKCIMS
jgi:hypothetical protein